jgi:tripartite-type tricarboxylate transporter receptor subunit TctC
MTMEQMRILLGAVLTLAWIAPSHAQRGPYPSAPVRVVVGFPPGGGVDVVARMIGQRMPGVWGQHMVVDNRPGAASILATRLVAGAAPDGYTVLINSNTMIVNQVGNPNAGIDVERQLLPILNVAWQPNIIVAAVALPAGTLAEVIALSRTRKLGFGSPGHGSMGHLAAAYLCAGAHCRHLGPGRTRGYDAAACGAARQGGAGEGDCGHQREARINAARHSHRR